MGSVSSLSTGLHPFFPSLLYFLLTGNTRYSRFIMCFSCSRHKINDFSKGLVPFIGEWYLEIKIPAPGVRAAPGHHGLHACARVRIPSAPALPAHVFLSVQETSLHRAAIRN